MAATAEERQLEQAEHAAMHASKQSALEGPMRREEEVATASAAEDADDADAEPCADEAFLNLNHTRVLYQNRDPSRNLTLNPNPNPFLLTLEITLNP